jgi:hypothetical protein
MPAKRLLKSRDKKFRILFEEHPQPMWILDPNGPQFLAVNRGQRMASPHERRPPD